MMGCRQSAFVRVGIVASMLLVLLPRAVAARTDDPQPCDGTAQLLTVITPAAYVQAKPSLDAEARTTVTNGTLLVVTGHQTDDAVGCWYQVVALPGQTALPVPAWIAGSTVRSVALAPGMSAPAAEPVPTVPTPSATYYVPSVPVYPSGSEDATPSTPGASTVPYAPPGASTVPSTPPVQGDPSTTSPASAPLVTDPDAVVSRAVTTRVCLDRNANTFCDVDEGVAGVPAYVIAPSGQVLAETRTDGTGVANALVQAPQLAQLAVNVPYLNAYQRISGVGEAQPILVPISAPIPGVLP